MTGKLRALTASGAAAGGGLEPVPSKLYFRIGEVAGMVGVEPHVLRYWEREFRAIRPTKSSKGQRVYSRKDVENLLRVRALLYEEGFTIAGAKKKLARPPAEPSTTAAPASSTRARVSPISSPSPSPSPAPSPVPPEAEPTTERDGGTAPASAHAVGAVAEPLHTLLERARDAEPPTLGRVVESAPVTTPSSAPSPPEPALDPVALRASLLELRTEIEMLLDELEGE